MSDIQSVTDLLFEDVQQESQQESPQKSSTAIKTTKADTEGRKKWTKAEENCCCQNWQRMEEN